MPNEEKFRDLLHKIKPDYQLISATLLKGGASAQTTKLDTLSGTGQKQTFLVRQHGENDRGMNPNIARDEYRLLDTLTQHINAPKPVAVDTDTFEFPCVILEYIEGSTSIEGIAIETVMQEMAEALVAIHRIPNAEATFSWLPQLSMRTNYLLHYRSNPTDATLGEDKILDALKSVPEIAESSEKSLLHGDYWANNILWHNHKLVTVLDWEDAMLGNPLADVGDSRISILWSYGQEAMQSFTQAYQKQMPLLDYSQLPYWDLIASLRPLSQFSIWAHDYHEATMRQQHRWFVEQAIENLG